MRILILSDLINNWAIHNRAKAIQKYLPQYDITIRAGLANSPALKDAGEFDIIHFNFSYGLTHHYAFIKRNLKKCLLTIVNERSYFIGHGVDPEQYKELMEICPYKTSVGPTMAKVTGAVYIPNGIDTDIFKESKKPIVGFSGTNREAKNMSAIVQACEDLGLEMRTANYNNNKPDLPHTRMSEFYKSLDVYVHASLTEGFNNTIIEALYCNVPVLMTKQGAWEEFAGWVDFIEDPTAEGVKKALQKFVGRKLIEQKYLWASIIPQYAEMYERIDQGL